MANQRTTFLKRQREADRNDKQKAKEQRLAQARSGDKPTTKGPQIAWDEAVTEQDSALTSDKPAATTNGNLSSPNANSNNTAQAKPSTSTTTTTAAKPSPAPVPAKPAPAAAKPAPAKPPVKP